jgi:hypothetical protein
VPPPRQADQDRRYTFRDCLGDLSIGLPLVGAGEFQAFQRDLPPSVEVIFTGADGMFGSLISTQIRDELLPDDRALDWLARRTTQSFARGPSLILGFLDSRSGRVFEKLVLNSVESPKDERVLMEGVHTAGSLEELRAIGISHYIVWSGRLLEFHLFLPNAENRMPEELIAYARLRCAEWRATLAIAGQTPEAAGPAQGPGSVGPETREPGGARKISPRTKTLYRDPPDVEEARAVALDFMDCLHRRDRAGARALVVDDFRLDEVFAPAPSEDEGTQEAVSAPDSLEAELIPDHEEFVALNTKGIPEGSVLRFMTNYARTCLVSVRKRPGKWLVDLRWWLAGIDMMREVEALYRLAESEEGERRQAEADFLRRERELPEYAAKGFLSALLDQDAERLRRFLLEGTDVDSLYPVGFCQDQNVNEYKAMVYEMPVVEVQEEEPLLAPTGEFARVREVADGAKVLVGEFGTKELVFLLEQQDGLWRVRPRDYLTELGFGP